MPNPVVHFEIISRDAKRLQRFYSRIFGWKIDAKNPMKYGMVDTKSPKRSLSGGIGAPMGRRRGWLTFYIGVKNIKAVLKRIERAGGRIAMPITEVPGGPTIAQFFDPAGNRIGLVEVGG